MNTIKSMAISAGFIGLLVFMIPVMQNTVVDAEAVDSPTYNLTTALAEGITELAPLAILVLAAAFILVSLGRLR
ncbi:MAG: hypothetical protein RI544_07575 [Haloquadratum sp.]|nr:hypothetical protein [Haloferacaceae archaeon]MDR9445974.1 hypothetical protein [Haloquadratum sp.]